MKTRVSLRKNALVAMCALALSSTALFAGHKAKSTEERGVIKSIDATAHQMVVTDQKTKMDRTFQWNEQTKFTEHKKSVNPLSLQSGMGINLTYEPGSGTPMLKSAQLSSASAQAQADASKSKHHTARKS